LSRSTTPEAAEAAFTLIEALAALTIMAIGLTAIGALASASLRAELHVERHLALIETTRKIIAGMPGRPELADGPLAGALDQHAWRIDAAPYPNSLAPINAPAPWQPQEIALRVAGPDGERVEIDMIRLRKSAR